MHLEQIPFSICWHELESQADAVAFVQGLPWMPAGQGRSRVLLTIADGPKVPPEEGFSVHELTVTEAPEGTHWAWLVVPNKGGPERLAVASGTIWSAFAVGAADVATKVVASSLLGGLLDHIKDEGAVLAGYMELSGQAVAQGES